MPSSVSLDVTHSVCPQGHGAFGCCFEAQAVLQNWSSSSTRHLQGGRAHFMRLSDCILSPPEIIFRRCLGPVHTVPAVTFCEKFVAGPGCRYCCNGAQGIKTIRFVFWNLRSSCVNPTHLGRVTKMLYRQEGPSPRSANPRSLITHISQLSCSRFTGYAGKPSLDYSVRREKALVHSGKSPTRELIRSTR
jgi:hypothetical protein